MPNIEQMMIRDATKERSHYIIAALITLGILLLIGGLYYWKMTRPLAGAVEEPQLEGALRSGDPRFEEHRELVLIEQPTATISPRMLGDFVMEMQAMVRNTTGQRINGLELQGIILDEQGAIIGERRIVAVPSQQSALEANEEMRARVLIEGLQTDAEGADIRLSVTGLRFD